MFSFFGKNSIKSIEVNKLDEDFAKRKIIDIREPYETSAGTIKGAKKVPMNTLLQNPEKYLNKETQYHIMCQSGMRSSRASKSLSKLGFDVVNVSGGFGSYRGKNVKR